MEETASKIFRVQPNLAHPIAVIPRHRVAFGALFSLMGGALCAQPAPVDLRERASAIGDKRVAREERRLKMHPSLGDLRFEGETWAPAFSAWNRKPAAPLADREAPIADTLTFPRFEAPEGPDLPATPAAKDTWSPGGANRRPADEAAALVRDAPVVRLAPDRPPYEAMVDDLSMADINRYTFQQNHDRESGLPVTPAASEGAAPTDGGG